MSRPSATPADWQRYMAHMATITPNASLARFYGSAWPAADTPLEEVEFVALDVETTGLDVRRHAIVSVGLIPMSLARIRSDQAWHQIIRPARELVPPADSGTIDLDNLPAPVNVVPREESAPPPEAASGEDVQTVEAPGRE